MKIYILRSRDTEEASLRNELPFLTSSAVIPPGWTPLASLIKAASTCPEAVYNPISNLNPEIPLLWIIIDSLTVKNQFVFARKEFALHWKKISLLTLGVSIRVLCALGLYEAGVITLCSVNLALHWVCCTRSLRKYTAINPNGYVP